MSGRVWSVRSPNLTADMWLKDAYRRYRSARLKRRILKNEKQYGEEFPVRYYLEKKPSKDLIVVFSAFPEHGKRASYNYVHTLARVKANKLFLLDEYGTEGMGCYYLGKDQCFTVEQNVKEIISRIKAECGAERVFFVGTSKGGWAAMYFGLQNPNGVIVCGGLQYLLGTYLSSCMQPLYEYIMGEPVTKEGVAYLDALLRGEVARSVPRTLYLHYSDQEHTFRDSVLPCLADLKKYGYTVCENIAHYQDHAQVGIYFAEYLPTLLRSLIGGRK